MKSESAWQADVVPPSFPKPTGDVHVDVLVVGGGITGITTARLLKNAGCRVVVADLRRIGGGETAHTTAHVTYVTDSRLHELVRDVGEAAAAGFWNAGEVAMQTIRELAEGSDCGLREVPGYLFAAEEAHRESLVHDAGLAAKLGYDARFLDAVPLFGRPGVQFANQLEFHPLRYLHALARELPGDGCHVLEETDGTRLDAEKRQLPFDGGVVHYDILVTATHVPIQGHRGMLSATLFQTKLASYSTYAIEARIPPHAEALYWDTADPYLYLRIDQLDEGTRAILGGEDHKTGQEEDTESRYERLEKTLRQIFPDAAPLRRWSGQVVETPDGLPYIGRTEERQYLATGFAGNGMTLGAFSATLIADLILDRRNPWADLFDPHRKKLAGAWSYVSENKDFPLHLVKDRLAPARKSPADLGPGEAAIVKIDGRRCAAHRNAEGRCTIVSATCPHMGCIVHWNAAEETWDCPCHGSRFTAEGDVIAGPAETGLEKVNVVS
jgi:glycine/D-amino acid oxidase-like deaminating enzyme/nitrite reductase/ring-hydroxylating ferredoxin subunit